MTAVDLLLGSDIGLWVAQTVPVDEVGRVTTEDDEIADVGRARGMTVGPLGEAFRALSVHYPHILGAVELARYRSAYNLHPAFLPWGRGHFPLVWAIANREPAGATLHRMTERVDAGPIVAQTEIVVGESETAGELHARIRAAERELFTRWWPHLVAGPIPERPQPPGGSYHDKAQFAALLAIDPDALQPFDVERLVRATAFPGKPGLARRPS